MSRVTAEGQDVALLIDYLSVCNEAIKSKRDALPYRFIIILFEKTFGDRQVGVEIYEADPEEAEASATVRFAEGVFATVPETEAEPAVSLKFQRSYMQEVVAHADNYIQHPEELDWGWLRSRLGFGSKEGGSPKGLGPHS